MLTVSNLLGTLQEDPHDAEAVLQLRDALASGDVARTGAEPMRLVTLAREQHEQRGEFEAAAALIAIEIDHTRDPDTRAALLKRLARIQREELLDDESAKIAFEAARDLRPGDDEVAEALEQIGAAESSWKEIAKRFVDEADTTSEPTLKTSLLVSAATFVWKYKKRGRDKDVDRLFRQALDSDPADARASRLYALVLRRREKWDELAAVLLDAAEKTRAREDRVGFYLQAARVIARQLEQPDRAAACYERVLDFAPGHPEGMRFLVEHFTAKEQWDHLVALYEDALRSRHKIENEQGMLLQVGMVHWRFRGSPAEAEPFFARLRKIDPAHPAMLDFYREHLKKTGEQQKLLSILTDAQRAVTDPRQKSELSMELARSAQAGGASDKSIDAWKAVLRNDPKNEAALAALRELYRAGEKWNALVEVLKNEIDAVPASEPARKVALLRESIPIYRDHLKLDVMVINAWNAILALQPDDAEALDALAATFEGLGRWNDLIQVLTKKADASSDPAEQIALYLRVAKLWIERFANYNQATRPLEQVVERDGKNREAIALLKDIYGKKRAFKQLFDVLKLEAELASDPEARHQHRIELARLAGDRLHRGAEAIPLWKDVLAHEPSNTEAVDALEKLAEREKDWATVADVIERRIASSSDDKERVKLLSKLGALWTDQAPDAAKAAAAWKRVVAIDPRNGRALRTLREGFVAAGDWEGLEGLYAETKDWDGLAEVLGNAAERTEDVDLKVALSFRAAAVYEQRIGDGHRAFRSYERVLAARPRDDRAARALIPLYEREEKWTRLSPLYETVAQNLKDAGEGGGAERLALLERLRVVALDRVQEPDTAMRWAIEAYRSAPSEAAVRSALEATAERTGQWARAVDAYVERAAAAPAAEARALRMRSAEIAAQKLGQVDLAVRELRAVLDADPSDAAAARELDRLLRQGARHGELRGLFEHRIAHAADDAERWMLLHEQAKLEENEVGDKNAAAELYRRALAIDASDREALEALDRLAVEAGRTEELASVLRARRDLAKTDDERRAHTLRLGEVLGDKVGDRAGAQAALAEVLEATPGEARAIAALERLAAASPERSGEIGRLLEPAYEATGDFGKLAVLLKARLSTATDKGERRELRLRVADLSAARLGDVEGAYPLIESAFLDDPADTELWDRLATAADAAGKHADAAAAFSMAIEGGSLSPEDQAALAQRVAHIHDVVLGKPEDAEPFHRKVLAVEPLAEHAFLALKELYTNAERWRELQDLYGARIERTVDAEAKLDLLLQVCFLFEELIDDPQKAIGAYRDVLGLDPRHAASRRALDRLFVRTGAHRDLVELLEGDLDYVSDGEAGVAEAARIHERLAGLYETQLGEPGKAVDQLEAALQKDETSTVATDALERLMATPGERQRVAAILEPVLERRAAWPALARVLEVQLEGASDKGAKVALLTRIAELARDRIGDAEAAFQAWARAVELDAGDATLRRELADAAARRGTAAALADRAAVLDLALPSLAGTGADVEVLREIAELYDGPLGDLDRAESAWTRLMVAAEGDGGTQLEAARALERIHLQKGDHAHLAEALRKQASLETDADVRRRLLVRLAELEEETLGRPEAAIATHKERLELDPGDADALEALRRLFERREEWSELIAILEKQDAAAATDEERRPIARRIGQIREEKLGDKDGAIAAYNDVVARFGADRETLSALVRLYESAERWRELLDVVLMIRDLAGEGARAGLTFHAAELMRTRTGEVERAIESLAEVLDADSGHEGAIESLLETMEDDEVEAPLRLSAARVLRPRFEALGDWTRLLSVLEALAKGDDPAERLDVLRRAAEVADGPLGDKAKAFELACRAVEVGVQESEIAHLLGEAERLAAESSRWADLCALLELVVADIPDADLQTDVLEKIASIAEHRLGDVEKARTHYLRVLEQRPERGAALDALERIATERQAWPDLLDVLRRKADAADGAARAALLVRQAEVCEGRLGDRPQAIDALDRALAEGPSAADAAKAYAGLERLYAETERWSDLSALYERMISEGAGPEVSIRHKLGRLLRERLGDPWAALEQFKTALGHGAPHEPTVEALEAVMAAGEGSDDREATALAGQAAAILEPIYLQRLQWPKVQAALEARARGEEDLDHKKALLLRLGQIREEYLEDLDGAMGVYARLFREDPRDASSWDTLARLARVLERWDRLAEIYKAALDETGVEDAETAKLAVTAAQIFDQRTQNVEAASALYKKALAYAPGDREVFDALELLYQRSSRWDDLLALYKEGADVAESDADRVALLEKAARVEAAQRNQPDAAIELYARILEVDPQHRGATEALDSLYAARERWSDLAEHLRHRIQYATGAEEATLRHRLGALLAERLEDTDAAIDTLEEVVRSDPRHAPSVAALERLVTHPSYQARIIEILDPIYRATDQWKKRVAIGEARLALLEDAHEKVGVLEEVARLLEERGGDAGLAFDAWARAFALVPDDEAVRGEVDRLGSMVGDWDAVVAAYEAAIAATDDAVTKSSLMNAVARLHDEKRGDPRAAIETYERLLEHDKEDASPLDALEALHTMVGDWRGMVRVLERKVERSYDPAERGEILRRAGSVAEDLLADRAGAIELYKRAVREDDTDAVALESLDRLYSESSEHAALAEVLKRRVEIETDPETRSDAALRLGQLCEEYLRDADAAIEAFQHALGDRPNDATAILALGRLYERQARWSDLLENLRLRAGLAEPAERVALSYRAAEVLERELDDVPEALATLEGVLALDPRHEPSIQSLVRIARLEDHRAQATAIVVPLLEQAGRANELAQMLELVAESASDPLEKRDVLRRLAVVHERGRGDLGAAFEALRRALVEDATDTSLVDELERVGAALGQWERLADVLSARALGSSDPDTARALYARVAAIAEERLGDDARALEAHKRTLEHVPDDDAALAALDRLHLKRQEWQELADVLDRRVQREGDPTLRTDLLVRLGTLRWEQFSDPRGAFAAFQEVLERDPAEPRALGAMEGLLAERSSLASEVVEVLDQAYRATGSTAKTAALYDVRIGLVDSASEQVRLLSELAAVRENELGDPSSALDALIRAWQIEPGDEATLGDVERLAMIVGGWERLRGLAEQVEKNEDVDRSTRRDVALRAASWYRDRLNDPRAAEQQLRAALAADRECGEAHAQLVELMRSARRDDALVAALSDWADVELDTSAKIERLREAARLAESSLGDAEKAASLLLQIVEADGSDADALDELVRIRRAQGRWQDVVMLLERRIDAEAEPTVRVSLRRQRAAAYEGPLADSRRAIEGWQAVLDEAPTDLGAIDALERLFDKEKRWGDLEDLVQRRLDIAETPAERIAARVRLARLVDRLGRRAEAIEQLNEILAEDPENGDALDELGSLYEKEKRFAELAELVGRRIASAASRGDAAGQLAGLRRLAALREGVLDDAAGAIEAHEQIVLRSPGDLDALDALVRLYEAAGRHGDAVGACERRAQHLTGAAAVAELFRASDLAAGKLSDPARAEASLRRAFELDPAAPEPRKRLTAHYEKHGMHAELAEMLALEVDGTSDRAGKLALLRRIADLQAQKLGDPGAAATTLERAVALDPEDRNVLLPLCDLYIAAGRQGDAVPVLQKIIASYGTKRTKEVAIYQHRMGQALEGMGKQPEALAAYDAAFKIDLTNVPILRDLGRICWRTGDFDRAQKTFRALLLQKLDAHSGITKGDVYYYLGDISAKQGDPKKGIQMLERAIVETPGHADATALLAQLKG